jgi:hypothetical protein
MIRKKCYLVPFGNEIIVRVVYNCWLNPVEQLS